MDKEKTIEMVAEKYHHLLRSNNFFPDYNQDLDLYDAVSSATRKHQPWEKFILAVETSYYAMQYHLRKIIKCDFFYQNYSFWWEDFYSKTNYKAFRKEAINLFIENLIKTGAINKNGEIIL